MSPTKLDQYWEATADFIRQHLSTADRIIAPFEMTDHFPGNSCHAYGDELTGKYDWLALHKGRLRETEDRGLFSVCLALEPVFANEVFIVFARGSGLERLSTANIHYRSFLSALEDQFIPSCLSGKEVHAQSSSGSIAGRRHTVYVGDHCALTRTVHGQAIYVDTRDRSVAPRLLLDGSWEENTTEIFFKHLKHGSTVIEIGANMGYYTLLAASKVGARGKVIAFEANSDLCDLLVKSLEINGFLDHSEVVNKAVTDATGTATFRKFREHMGEGSLAATAPGFLEKHPDSSEEIRVETTSLDDFLRERGLPCPDLIKIDAEGSEPLVFKGLQRTLENATNLVVIFELNVEMILAMGHDPQEMLQSLLDKGFCLQRITLDGLVPLVSSQEARSWPVCDIVMQKHPGNIPAWLRFFSEPVEILYFTPFFKQPLTDAIGFSPGVAEDLCTVTTDHSRLAAADAVLFHIPNMKGPPAIPKRPGQLWVGMSMESDENYPLQADPDFMRHFDIVMSFRMDSDIPLLYFSPLQLSELTAPPKWKFRSAPAVYFASNNVTHNSRYDFVRELMLHMKVDSYGKSQNNRPVKNDVGRVTKLNTISRYLFYLAFENTNSRDYVSEKVFDGLAAGTVPVYMGASNVDDFMPARKCIIKAGDFGSPAQLARHLLALKKDRAEYRSYLAWKKEPLQKSFMDLIRLDETPALRRLCYKISGLLKK